MNNQETPPCPSGRYLKIAAGDTLYLIAQRVGTTVSELLLLNPGLDHLQLQIGQLLCIPQRPCPSMVFWEVSPGDTLFTIAKASGTTVGKLLELNPGIDPLSLQIGQAVCLPG
ncbi:MAG: LysM domain-containing protein [Firmicutes bacterium]|nr:LysM domain-containing protein [Bacillota bacterium]